MFHALQLFLSEEDGVDAIEYGLLAALIFLVIIAAVSAAAVNATGLFTRISTAMTSV